MIFQNLKINNINLKNRVVVSPMCQYSSLNGSPSKWHYQHLEHLSSTGASMVLLESTAVDKQGKYLMKTCVYIIMLMKKI